jgi:small subunit ribosomal protein S6
MKENRTHEYEAMFLLRQSAAADLGAAVENIREYLARAEGQIIAMKKWDERRLAYEIKKQKRGVFILVYVTLPTAAIAKLERTLNLSEDILRWMLVRVDHLNVDEMKAMDAQQELADEIKLREDRAREKADGAESASAPAPAQVKSPPAGPEAKEEPAQI